MALQHLLVSHAYNPNVPGSIKYMPYAFSTKNIPEAATRKVYNRIEFKGLGVITYNRLGQLSRATPDAYVDFEFTLYNDRKNIITFLRQNYRSSWLSNHEKNVASGIYTVAALYYEQGTGWLLQYNMKTRRLYFERIGNPANRWFPEIWHMIVTGSEFDA